MEYESLNETNINNNESIKTINIRRLGSNSFLSNLGPQGPTYLMEQNTNAHKKDIENGINDDSKTNNGNVKPIQIQNGSLTSTIRFQLIVWSIGHVDVVMGRVSMKFRVTLFWNDAPDSENTLDSSTKKGPVTTHYQMKGRQRALLKQETQDDSFINVPPLAILNAVSFQIIGQPEVSCLNHKTKLMRWTCLYKTELLQEDMRVDHFPHDEHDLTIKLGIITKREPGEQWDRRKWNLALATEEDSQNTIRVPHGVIVDHVEIPGFYYTNAGMIFDFATLSYGQEEILEVKIPVVRDSGYYDVNFIPLLCALNAVAITYLSLDATCYFQRTLMNLNVCFAEIGLRMTTDKNLPSVGYQIKIQIVQNRFLYTLLCLALESSFVYSLHQYFNVELITTRKIDMLAGCLAFLDLVRIGAGYYLGLWTQGHYDVNRG